MSDASWPDGTRQGGGHARNDAEADRQGPRVARSGRGTERTHGNRRDEAIGGRARPSAPERVRPHAAPSRLTRNPAPSHDGPETGRRGPTRPSPTGHPSPERAGDDGPPPQARRPNPPGRLQP